MVHAYVVDPARNIPVLALYDCVGLSGKEDRAAADRTNGATAGIADQKTSQAKACATNSPGTGVKKSPGNKYRPDGVLCSSEGYLAATLLACGVWGQAPHIGDINVYGVRKLSPDKVLAAAGLASGGRLPASKGDAEEAIEKLSGVILARIEAVCCDGSAAQVFVGVEEKGAPYPSMRSVPDGDAHLPQEIVDTYHGYLVAVARAAAVARLSKT